MCGIVAMVQKGHVNQLLYDALLLLQHRGQDAAGIATQMDRKFFMYKAKGHGARRFSHTQHARPARQLRPGSGALPHSRQRIQ